MGWGLRSRARGGAGFLCKGFSKDLQEEPAREEGRGRGRVRWGRNQVTMGSQVDPTGSSGVSCTAKKGVARGQGAALVCTLSAPREGSGGG